MDSSHGIEHLCNLTIVHLLLNSLAITIIIILVTAFLDQHDYKLKNYACIV